MCFLSGLLKKYIPKSVGSMWRQSAEDWTLENTSRDTKSKLFRPSLKILHNWFPRIANSSLCACPPSSPGSTRASFPLLVTTNILEFSKHIKALIFVHFLFPSPQNTISFVCIFLHGGLLHVPQNLVHICQSLLPVPQGEFTGPLRSYSLLYGFQHSIPGWCE